MLTGDAHLSTCVWLRVQEASAPPLVSTGGAGLPVWHKTKPKKPKVLFTCRNSLCRTVSYLTALEKTTDKNSVGVMSW